MEAKYLREIAGLEWVNPRKESAKRSSNMDLSIRTIQAGHKGNYCTGISFTLRNGTYKYLGEYVELAICKNRVYFKSVDHEALHFMNNKASDNYYARITVESKTTKILEQFVGDYDLEYDKYLEFYYVEKKDEVVK